MNLTDRTGRFLKIEEIDETLFDLITGCLIYSLFFEIIGLMVVHNKMEWTLGLALGTAVAVCMSISMYRGIWNCIGMEPAAAGRSMTIRSILRVLLMLAAAWLGIRTPWFSFPAVITGILGLKVSAHLHIYTNIYITKKIRRKGR